MNNFSRIRLPSRLASLYQFQNGFCGDAHSRQNLQDVPTIHGFPFVGTLFSFLSSGGAEQLHKYIDKRHSEIGPIFKEYIGPICSVFVSDTNIIREIFANEGKYPRHVIPESWSVYNKLNDNRRGLFFMDGEEWFTHRKHLNRILLKDDVEIMANKMGQSGFLEKHFESWLNGREHSIITNLEENLYILSITFVVYYLLGTPFFENERLFSSRIHKLANVVRRIFECSVQLSTIPAELARRLNLKIWQDYSYAVNESVKFSSELLNEMSKFENGDGLLRDMLEIQLSRDVIDRIVVDLIIAASDTTATATQWLFYSLAKNKNIQKKLREELQNGVGDVLLKNAIRESMRLYPVAPFIARYLPHDVEIPPYRLKTGDLVSLSMYTCSRSEQYFPNASDFNPDRWLRLDDKKTFAGINDTNASLPYSKGGRSCIGRRMADAQLRVMVKRLITLYELDVSNTVDIKLHLISVPSEPIKLRLEKIHN